MNRTPNLHLPTPSPRDIASLSLRVRLSLGKSLSSLRGGDAPLLCLIVFTAVLNHLFTFLAYDWYAGIDSYSYDVAGFQLVTGLILDPYPLMFRAPLVPIIKNLLYMVFEGHQVLFGIFLHLLGIATTYLAWRLGRRFSRTVGATTGMFMALALPISVHFHHLSVTTIYIPLLILTADQFIVWIRKPDRIATIALAILVFFCCITRAEAVALVPIFALSGWLTKIRKTQIVVFLGITFLLYNFICLLYFNTLGYWGTTKNTGFSLYSRTAFPDDRLFSENNGQASQRVGGYLRTVMATKLTGAGFGDLSLVALNLAQDELGYLGADRLFLQAGKEAISHNPSHFIKDTLLRLLGQMDIHDPGSRHNEYPTESDSGHMWGYGEERMSRKHYEYENAKNKFDNLFSPLQWERNYLKAKLLSAIGISVEAPTVPIEFQMTSNINTTTQGESSFLYSGDCVLVARPSIVHHLDDYFFWSYWGEGRWSPSALKILAGWDKTLPTGTLRLCLHFTMWVLWVLAILLAGDRKNQVVLLAFLSFVIFSDFCQVIFSDNYGRRFFFFTVTFLWLGGTAGGELLARRVINMIKSPTPSLSPPSHT